MKPNFIIIGDLKCATSSLHGQLSELDGICMSDSKEPNFFSDDKMYEKGESWCQQVSETSEDDFLVGEAVPTTQNSLFILIRRKE